VQVALSLIGGPADDLIPRFDLPGARAEAQGGDDVAGGMYEVAQLRPGHGLYELVEMLHSLQTAGLVEAS